MEHCVGECFVGVAAHHCTISFYAETVYARIGFRGGGRMNAWHETYPAYCGIGDLLRHERIHDQIK